MNREFVLRLVLGFMVFAGVITFGVLMTTCLVYRIGKLLEEIHQLLKEKKS